MNKHQDSTQDPYLRKDDTDADAFAILGILVILAITVVYYLTG